MTVVIQRRYLHSGFIPDTLLESPDTLPAATQSVSGFKPEPCPVSNRNRVRYHFGMVSDINRNTQLLRQ